VRLLTGVLLVLVIAGVAGGIWLRSRRAQARAVARQSAVAQSSSAFQPLINCVVGEPLAATPELATRLQSLIAERHEKLGQELGAALERCTATSSAQLSAPLLAVTGERSGGEADPIAGLHAAAQALQGTLAALVSAVGGASARDELDSKLANEQANPAGGAAGLARCALGEAAARQPPETVITALVDRCFKSDPTALVDSLVSGCAAGPAAEAPGTATKAVGYTPAQDARVRQALRHCLREARLRRTAVARRSFAHEAQRYWRLQGELGGSRS
jgi:hypothetical protein